MVGVTTESMNTLETVMKPAIMLSPVLISACDGSATEPSSGTAPSTPRLIRGPMRRALRIAAVVMLAACGGDGATEVGPDTTGSI